ncbi:MAG: hypothetical protein KIT86_10000 [Hydrogenophaga sp.]|uniref:hypothetical protein n=1 Tax=Hydrogenophaga sp. TaxID=1904254 RepID=UPI0026115ED2|nr:hypothetical protein [Hydrogenophaga sp.]MCW5669985.1 hypothetical protein [Hydrogenophaga sp.]
MPNFQIELNRLIVQTAVLELIAWVVGFVVLYFVVRAAVRDGINESRLGERTVAKPRARPSTHDGNTLPPMHAD